MHRKKSNASDRSASIVWSGSPLSDGISTHFCSRSAEYAALSRDRTWAATTINSHMRRHRHEERVQLKISAQHCETADQRSVSRNQTLLCLSFVEGLRRRRRGKGARLCRSHAGHCSTKANGFHAPSCCVRAHGWHVAGAGEVAQEYGIEAIGRESEWARLRQGMSLSSTNEACSRVVRAACKCSAGTWSSWREGSAQGERG